MSQQQQESGSGSASGRVRQWRPGAVRLALAAASLAAALAPMLAAADTCYRDDSGRIVTRRRPGYVEVPCPAPQAPGSVPGAAPENGPANAAPPEPGASAATGPERGPPPSPSPIPRPALTDYPASVPVPDRWRIVDALGYSQNFWDPYNRNVLKADKPVHGDWFFNLSLFSDTVYDSARSGVARRRQFHRQRRRATTCSDARQQVFSQTVAADFVSTRAIPCSSRRISSSASRRCSTSITLGGRTCSRSMSIRMTARRARTASWASRTPSSTSICATSPIDMTSTASASASSRFRPISADFLFQDNQLGIRLFGTRDNNVFQYNLACFRRIEKDTNSGLNDLGQPLRRDDVFIANVYWQDMPVSGFTPQATVVYNRNREGDESHYDSNGFLVRPAPFGTRRSAATTTCLLRATTAMDISADTI